MNIRKIKKSLYGDRLTVVNVEKVINNLGYSVVFFNTECGDKEIERYELNAQKSTLPAFTYASIAHIVFIDAKRGNDDQLYLLLHELGHIVLGHIGDGNIIKRNKYLMDIEADNFAYGVLQSRKCIYYLYLTVGSIILLAFLVISIYINV